MTWFCHNVPRLSSTKIRLQALILSTSLGISSIYIPDWLKSFFVLAGNERAFVEVAGGLPDWLEFFRGKRAEWFWGLEFECETLGDIGHVGCSQKCTPWRSCLLKQAQSVLIWVVLREAFHINTQGISAGVCAGAFESTGPVHSSTGPWDTHTKLYTESWKQPNINIADLLFFCLCKWEQKWIVSGACRFHLYHKQVTVPQSKTPYMTQIGTKGINLRHF